jgi:aspartyl-tRNA(Asn)/glutamyl-tRNA(Gln) amidotransferase subunit A
LQAYSAATARLQAEGAITSAVEVPGWLEIIMTGGDLQGPEAVANHVGRAVEDYQPDVQQRLQEAAEVPAWRYVKARERAAELTAELGELLGGVDAILLPTVQLVAPTFAEYEEDPVGIRLKLLRNTPLASLTGYPAYSLPLPVEGLPIGLQVVALDNQLASRVALWIEQALASRPQAVDEMPRRAN